MPPSLKVNQFEEKNNPTGTVSFNIEPAISCPGYSQFIFRYRRGNTNWAESYLMQKAVVLSLSSLSLFYFIIYFFFPQIKKASYVVFWVFLLQLPAVLKPGQTW